MYVCIHILGSCHIFITIVLPVWVHAWVMWNIYITSNIRTHEEKYTHTHIYALVLSHSIHVCLRCRSIQVCLTCRSIHVCVRAMLPQCTCVRACETTTCVRACTNHVKYPRHVKRSVYTHVYTSLCHMYTIVNMYTATLPPVSVSP